MLFLGVGMFFLTWFFYLPTAEYKFYFYVAELKLQAYLGRNASFIPSQGTAFEFMIAPLSLPPLQFLRLLRVI